MNKMYATIDKNILIEFFVLLNWNGIIVDRYLISDFGRLYDKQKQCFVNYSVDKDGYFMASITVPGIGYKKIRVHRFEMLSFNYIDNYKDFQVNHKDGNKQNLYIGNLEWSTPLENTRHGWNTGLNQNTGINNGNSKHDDSFIHKICELIDSGYNNSQISDYFNIYEKSERMRMSATITGIRNGKTHKYISNEYSFMSGKIKKDYNEFSIHLLCKILSDGNTYSYKEVMDMMQIPNEDRRLYRVFINDVIHKRTGKVITDRFYPNIQKPIIKDDDELIS